MDRDRAPGLERADERLRHEEAHLQFRGGSMRTTGLPAATHSPSRYSVSNTRPALRGQHRLLVELPRRLLERGARGRDLRRLRLDLLVAARQLRNGELAAQLRDARRVGRVRGAAVVELRARDAADLELRLVARELRRGLLLVDLRLRELRARDVLLRRALAELQIGKLRLGRLHLLLRLPLRRRFAHGLERVEARVDGDFVAALDRQLIETPGNRRRRR